MSSRPLKAKAPNVWVPPNDRARLEQLCRYLLRPPVAQDRLRLRADGRVLVELKTVWRDGTSHLLFEPIEFMEKLAAIIPRPAINLVLYHGALAPHARWRLTRNRTAAAERLVAVTHQPGVPRRLGVDDRIGVDGAESATNQIDVGPLAGQEPPAWPDAVRLGVAPELLPRVLLRPQRDRVCSTTFAVRPPATCVRTRRYRFSMTTSHGSGAARMRVAAAAVLIARGRRLRAPAAEQRRRTQARDRWPGLSTRGCERRRIGAPHRDSRRSREPRCLPQRGRQGRA